MRKKIGLPPVTEKGELGLSIAEKTWENSARLTDCCKRKRGRKRTSGGGGVLQKKNLTEEPALQPQSQNYSQVEKKNRGKKKLK